MNVVLRIGFWLSLFGLAVAIVAPMISSAASWAEAEAGVFIGLFFTLVFWATSIASVKPKQGEDPFDHAMRKRRAGIVYSVLAFLVMTGVGAIGETGSQDQLRGSSSTPTASYGDPYGSYRPSEDHWALDDAATGTWSCVAAMVTGAIPFLGMIVYLAKKPRRQQGQFQGHQAGYGPQAGFAPNGYAQSGYGQYGYNQGYAQNGYAQNGYAQNGYAQNGYAQNGYGQDAHGQNGYAQNQGYQAPAPGEASFQSQPFDPSRAVS